jgi:hypothetical protein
LKPFVVNENSIQSLSNSKYELKHLILQKTSIERDRAPVLYFERLKLHSDGN